MNPFKKGLVAVAALTLAFTGVLATASAASAHTGDLSVTAACNTATGNYDLTAKLAISQTGLDGSTKWRVGTSGFEGTPSNDTGMDRGPIASSGTQTITLGTWSLPGTTTGKGPWVYAFTTWPSDGFTKGSDGQLLTNLDGKCKVPPPVVTEVVVPALAVTPPTCYADGSLPFTSNPPAQNPNGYEFPGQGFRVYLDKAYTGPGTYIATPQKIGAGFDPAFPGGTKLAAGSNAPQTLTVLPSTGPVQSTDPSKPCFVPPTNSVCERYDNGPTSTDLVDLWANVDTRSKGHVEYVENALHVWTEDSSSQSKVSEGIAVNFPLSQTGTLAIDATANPGNVYPNGPGLNLFVDFDNNGSVDGTLVYETVYGQDLWLTNGSAQFVKDGAPVVGGGNGSQWHGTINQWLTKFPNAQVSGVAYSLGSGVQGDWNINSITFNCKVYTFDLIAKPTALSGEDVVTDVDCLTETHSTTTTPWTQAYVASGNEYVLGEKVYGEPTTVTREATNEELNNAECPAPEPPVITPTVNTVEKVTCEATLVSGETTTTAPTYEYVEADREWVRGEDDVKVVPFTREKTDAEKLICVVVTSVPPALVKAGTDPLVLFLSGLTVLLMGGGALYLNRRRVGAAE